MQRKDVQLNHAAGGTVVQGPRKDRAALAPRPPSKISFDADVKLGQAKAKRDVSQLNELITDSASHLALCYPIKNEDVLRGDVVAANAAAQQRPAHVAAPQPTAFPAAAHAATLSDEQLASVALFSNASSSRGKSTALLGPFGASASNDSSGAGNVNDSNGAAPGLMPMLAPFSSSNCGGGPTDVPSPFRRPKPSDGLAADAPPMKELTVDWAAARPPIAHGDLDPAEPATSGHSHQQGPGNVPRPPALTLAVPKRSAPVLKPMPMADSALPVHKIFLWCRDPNLETWVTAKMFAENFGCNSAGPQTLVYHHACSDSRPTFASLLRKCNCGLWSCSWAACSQLRRRTSIWRCRCRRRLRCFCCAAGQIATPRSPTRSRSTADGTASRTYSYPHRFKPWTS